MMEAEMDNHLGYEKSERSDSDGYRNGYKQKRVNSSYGSMEIDVPQDRPLDEAYPIVYCSDGVEVAGAIPSLAGLVLFLDEAQLVALKVIFSVLYHTHASADKATTKQVKSTVYKIFKGIGRSYLVRNPYGRTYKVMPVFDFDSRQV